VTRECGSCSACCAVLEVRAVDSPAWTPCDKQIEGGCGIYADRPECCVAYRCLWLQGELGEDDRPNKVGVIVDRGLSPVFLPTWGADAVCVRETHEGASKSVPAARIIHKLVGEGRPVFLKYADGSTEAMGKAYIGDLAGSRVAGVGFVGRVLKKLLNSAVDQTALDAIEDK